MGRFYSIKLIPPPAASTPTPTTVGGLTVIGKTTASVGPRVWTSVAPSGADDPGALDVEFDFFSFADAGSGKDGSTLTIHGVALTDLLQAQNFFGSQILVEAGMSKGLPLSVSHNGLILSGKVFQSFGNWVGTEMNLNFVVYASTYTYANPGNFSLVWRANTSLADALKTTLNTAFPNLGIEIKIANAYVRNHDVTANYKTLGQLATWVQKATHTATSAGVTISTPVNNTIFITDYSTPTLSANPTKLEFTDLIGQPTWLMPNRIQFTTIMRADIQVNTLVKMPPGLQAVPGIVTTAASTTNAFQKYKMSFQGNFLITAVRQVGNFRDPNGASWATVFEAVPQVSANAG